MSDLHIQIYHMFLESLGQGLSIAKYIVYIGFYMVFFNPLRNLFSISKDIMLDIIAIQCLKFCQSQIAFYHE